jgi:hypothetical protein
MLKVVPNENAGGLEYNKWWAKLRYCGTCGAILSFIEKPFFI